jgi:hypothetical protein
VWQDLEIERKAKYKEKHLFSLIITAHIITSSSHLVFVSLEHHTRTEQPNHNKHPTSELATMFSIMTAVSRFSKIKQPLFGLVMLFFLTTYCPTAAFSPYCSRPRQTGGRGWLITSGATIYSPDGSIEDYSDIKPYQQETNSFMDSLQKVDKKAMLARLACAFAPPGYAMNPKDLETVHVLAVDESHIELSAIICEGGGCVSVSVPVQFLNPCVSDVDEECILQNISELNHKAETVIAELEWRLEHHEDVKASQRTFLELVDDSTTENYPFWFVFPKESMIMGMAAECSLLRDLLNKEGFQVEVLAMASLILNQHVQGGEEQVVEQAGVSLVGPAGLILRAKIQQPKRFDDESGFKIVDVPIPFEVQAKDAQDLRSAVLAAVASAMNED